MVVKQMTRTKVNLITVQAKNLPWREDKKEVLVIDVGGKPRELIQVTLTHVDYLVYRYTQCVHNKVYTSKTESYTNHNNKSLKTWPLFVLRINMYTIIKLFWSEHNSKPSERQ